ncbi:MAG: hypothetical protein Q8R12_01270 [bacterium]|nr:hypothetical protein [bacterium]
MLFFKKFFIVLAVFAGFFFAEVPQAGATVATTSRSVYQDATAGINFATGAGGATGAELNDGGGLGDFAKAIHAPTRDEIMMVFRTTPMNVVRCVGGCDAAADATVQFGASVTAAQTCDATTLGSCWRAYDVAYEQLSGRAMVAFATSTAAATGKIDYRLYDGTSWTATSTLTVTGSTGLFRWVRLVARGEGMKDNRSNEILLVALDENSDIFSAIWDGTAWGNQTTITTTASTPEIQSFDGAWEQTTGNAMVAWSEGTTATTSPIKFKRWIRSSTTWDAGYTSLPAMGASHIGHWVVAKGAPVEGKNHIAIISMSAATLTTGNACATATDCRAQPYIWDGSTMALGNEWTSHESMFSRTVDVTVESLNTGVEVLYVGAINTAATDESGYETWIEGTGFSAVTDLPGAMGDDAVLIQLSAHPNSNEIMITGQDFDSDCNGSIWTGSGAQDWDITGCNSSGETALDHSCNNTAGEGFSVYVSTTPYSPWSRNWRFYGDVTEDDPDNTTDVLNVGENIQPGVDQEQFVRLRMQFNELAANAQTDARKKIQWTTCADPNASTCTWTNVGDTSETTAVWRYATAGETCASCSDNTAIVTARLTGTGQNGAYISDKDAAAGTNMDHNSLALAEYDFPLKAEDTTGGTTYYFRAYDVEQLTPVFREQDDDGSNDCSNAACAYPNVNVNVGVAATSVISGTIYTNEGTTELNSAGKTVTIRVGTSTPGFFATTTVAGTGVWRMTVNETGISAGIPVQVWIDGDTSFRAFAFTKASSTSNNISGLDLYRNRVILKHEGFTGTTTRNVDLDVYDGGDDADIQFSVSGTDLAVNAAQMLYVAPGSEFAPGGALTIAGNASSTITDGSLKLPTGQRQDGTATSSIMTLGGNLTLAGSLFASSTSKFTSGSNTVTFSATTTGKNIYATSSPLGNVTFSGVGGGWTFGGNASTTNFFINGGVSSVTAPSGLLSISGNYNATSTFTHNSGTILFDGAGAQSIAGATSTSAFNDVQFLGGGTKSFWQNASTTNLTIGSGVTLSAPALLTVSGNFVNSQSFTHNSGEVFMTGTSNTLDAGGATFNNLNINPASAGTITVSTTDLTVAGTLTVASGDTLSISSARALTSGSAGTVTINGTISGAGTLAVQNSNLGTGGTLSSIIRFDATGATLTMPSRTYGGLVEIFSSGTSGTTTLAAGTHTLSGALNLLANGAGNITLSGNANNPTVNLTGDLDFTGTGDGSEALNAGTGAWTGSGNIDFTGGTFAPSTGGTLIMNGAAKTLTSAGNAYNNLTLSGTIITADALTATGTSLTLSGSTIILGGSASASGGATLSAGSIYPQSQPIILTGTSQTLTGGSGQAGALSVSGSYTLSGSDLIVGTTTIASGGTLTLGAGRTYTSTSTLTLIGTLSGAGTTTIQHSNLTSGGTLSSNVRAGTTTSINLPARTFSGNLEVASGSTVVAAAATTTLLGNYINNGTFTANGGDFLLNGTSQQALSGTLSESSAFARLTIFNTSGTDATTSPSVIFASVASSTNTFYASSSPSASVKIRFPASATSTFQNLYWDGGAADTRVMPRSSTSGTRFGFAVPGSRLKISNVDFMDTNACSGDANLDASGGTNRDSGNNGCIDFVLTAATISSAANQVFEISTNNANSQITVTAGNGSGAITAANDLRIAIATSTINMVWLTSDTSATIGGSPQACTVSGSVSYEGSGSVLVVPISGTDCNSGDVITISDLQFTAPGTGAAAAAILKLYLDGANDISANATDDKTIAIKGTQTLANHSLATEENKLGDEVSSVTNAELFSFRLTPAGESVNSTITAQLADLVGMVCGDLTTVELYADFSADGGVNGGDAAVGGTPTCSINTANKTGTLSFSAFATSTARDYILRANVSNVDPGDKIAFSLASSNVSVSGVTSSESITSSGGPASKMTHARPSGTTVGGGSSTGGGSPASETPAGGATGGGGGSGAGGGTPPPETPQGGGTGGGGGGDVFIPFRRLYANVLLGLTDILSTLLDLLKR